LYRYFSPTYASVDASLTEESRTTTHFSIARFLCRERPNPTGLLIATSEPSRTSKFGVCEVACKIMPAKGSLVLS
jgi:hypothetical protein